MYFWNVKKLSEELKANTLGESEKLKYYVTLMLFFSVGMSMGNYEPAKVNGYLIAQDVLTIFWVFFGSWICFKANASGDNRFFIERMICISVPVIVRIAVLAFALFIFLGIGMAFFSGKPSDLFQESSAPELILVNVLQLTLALWTRKEILFISGQEGRGNV